MRTFWDDAARRNAVWYVDTSLAFDEPDLDRFFATGRQVVRTALDEAPEPPPGTDLAVEIGSGVGRMALALAERFDRVVGVDIAPEMVERARRLVDHPRVSFEVGDGARLAPIGDGTADVVFSFTVFQHIPDREVIFGYLGEAARVLRPGGLMVFQWNALPWGRLWPAKRWALDLLQRSGVRPEHYGRHAPPFLGSRIHATEMRRALQAAGFDVLAMHGTGTLYAWAWAKRRP